MKGQIYVVLLAIISIATTWVLYTADELYGDELLQFSILATGVILFICVFLFAACDEIEVTNVKLEERNKMLKEKLKKSREDQGLNPDGSKKKKSDKE